MRSQCASRNSYETTTTLDIFSNCLPLSSVRYYSTLNSLRNKSSFPHLPTLGNRSTLLLRKDTSDGTLLDDLDLFCRDSKNLDFTLRKRSDFWTCATKSQEHSISTPANQSSCEPASWISAETFLTASSLPSGPTSLQKL